MAHSFLKRLLDISISLLLLPVAGFLVTVLGILHLVIERTPPFLVQKRIGMGEKPFNLIKLRTMKLGTKVAGTHEISRDSLTSIGLFLRKSKFDELPQLVNVLAGSMSLVGPRPCLPVQTEVRDERRSRGVFTVRPGITGLSQLNRIDMSDPFVLAKCDADYVKTASLSMDIKLLWRTLTGGGAGDCIKNPAGAEFAQAGTGKGTLSGQRHIVYVVTRGDTIAGAQVHVSEMAKAVMESGHKATVIYGEGTRLGEHLDRLGIGHVYLKRLGRRLSIRNDLHSIFALTRALRHIRPDLVSLHSSKAGILGRLACRAAGIPCVFTAHGWAFSEGVGRRAKFYAIMEKASQRLCEKIICVSRYDFDLALNHGFESSKMSVVRNGRPDTTALAQHSNAHKAVEILMVGRLDAQKDHETLFRAVSEIDNTKLVLVGDGPYLPELRRLARELNIDDRVEFTGLVNDMSPYYASADIFALITHWEGFPRSTVEAMAFSLPVVVSDVGGASEALIDGDTGILVKHLDVAGVRMALKRLVDDEVLRRRMGVAGRSRYLGQFTFDRMRDSTFSVYEQTIGPAFEPVVLESASGLT